MIKKKDNPWFQFEEQKLKKIIIAAKYVFFSEEHKLSRLLDFRNDSISNQLKIKSSSRRRYQNLNSCKIRYLTVLLRVLEPQLNNKDVSVNQKIELLVSSFIELLFDKPDYALLLLDVLLSQSSKLDSINLRKENLFNSHFLIQFIELKKKGKRNFTPQQLLINLTGMILLPLVTTEVNSESAILKNGQLFAVIEQRKKMLPVWISALIE